MEGLVCLVASDSSASLLKLLLTNDCDQQKIEVKAEQTPEKACSTRSRSSSKCAATPPPAPRRFKLEPDAPDATPDKAALATAPASASAPAPLESATTPVKDDAATETRRSKFIFSYLNDQFKFQTTNKTKN